MMTTSSSAAERTHTTISAGALSPSTATARPSLLSSAQFASLLAAIISSEKQLDLKLITFMADVKEAQDNMASKAVSQISERKALRLQEEGQRGASVL